VCSGGSLGGEEAEAMCQISHKVRGPKKHLIIREHSDIKEEVFH